SIPLNQNGRRQRPSGDEPGTLPKKSLDRLFEANKCCSAISFWCLNIGLAMMTFLSLLPQGAWQAYRSID
ncbi:MAG: hypothetical protein ACK5M4_10520, partial [Pseudorhodobacter sp.]